MKNILLGLALVSITFPAFANPAYSGNFTPAIPDYVDDGGVPLTDEEAFSLMDEGMFVPEEPAPQPEQPSPMPQPEQPAPQPEQPAPEQPAPEQPAPMPQPEQPRPTEPQPHPHPEQPAPAPRPVPRPLPRPVPMRGWVCVAADRHGHRFIGRSFIPGQARRIALLTCQRSRLIRPLPLPRPFRGCHIVRCFRR